MCPYELGSVSWACENLRYLRDKGTQSSGVLLASWLADICWCFVLIVSWGLAYDYYSYQSGISLRIQTKYLEIASSKKLLQGSRVVSWLEPQFNRDSNWPSSLTEWSKTPWSNQAFISKFLYLISITECLWRYWLHASWQRGWFEPVRSKSFNQVSYPEKSRCVGPASHSITSFDCMS